jgi:hypothetical protein
LALRPHLGMAALRTPSHLDAEDSTPKVQTLESHSEGPRQLGMFFKPIGHSILLVYWMIDYGIVSDPIAATSNHKVF